MRKRIIIGLVALVVIGVVVYVAMQPRKGSVEYHKRKYLEAHSAGAVGHFIMRGPSALKRAYFRHKRSQAEFHRQALIDTGHFGEKVFVISNRPPDEVASKIMQVIFDVFTNGTTELDLPMIRTWTTNTLTAVAPSDEMHKWEELIRKFDVPENGN